MNVSGTGEGSLEALARRFVGEAYACVDEHGAVVSLSAEAASRLGLPGPAQAVGRPWEDILPLAEREQSASLQALMHLALASGERVYLRDHPFTLKNGRTLYIQLLPVRDALGQTLLALGLSETQPKGLGSGRLQADEGTPARARRMVEPSSAAVLKALLAHTAEGVLWADRERRIHFLNTVAEGLTGWSRSQAEGRLLEEVFAFTPAREAVLQRKGNTPFPGPPGAAVPGTVRAFDGREIPVDVLRLTLAQGSDHLLLLRPAEGPEGSRLASLENEAYRMYTGSVAHDLCNLLLGLQGNVMIARESLDDPREATDQLLAAEKALDRARGLSQELLQGHGRRTFEPVPIDLARMLEEAVDILLSGEAVETRLDLPEDLWRVRGVADPLYQVFSNLLVNAAQALEGRREARITLRAHNLRRQPGDEPESMPPGPCVRVEVVDNGAGIPADILPKIFLPHFTTKGEGTGLGLSTVYTLLQAMNGDIAVESTPGKGTTFSVWLPAAS